jgi:hypothetical protein
VGESVKQINTSFPHWFNANFKEFNDDPSRLPFDQHALIALCAPRAVLISTADNDVWSNPGGQFQALGRANSVYQLSGVLGLDLDLPTGRRIAGRLGYFNRSGEHSMTRTDWAAFLDFADRQWGVRR